MLSNSINTIKTILAEKSPYILTAIGSAGVIATAFSASRDTLKAKEVLDQHELPLPKKQLIKECWKCYIPTYLTALASISCVVGASVIQHKRTAAFYALYSITETSLKEYKDTIEEIAGSNVKRKVDEHIVEKHLEENPPKDGQIIVTGKGDMLCYDTLSGRYFRSNPETLRRIQNEINHALIGEQYISLNEVYDFIGLPNTKLGDHLGWTNDKLLEFIFTSKLTQDNEPCLVLDYDGYPKEKYNIES